MRHRSSGTGVGALVLCGVGILMLVGWIRHVVWTIMLIVSGDAVAGGQVAMAVLGALVAPFGAIHGILVLFGVVG